MRISLETDYAVRIVQCLSNNNTRLDASSISGKTGVTQRFALKILHKLVGAGIVNSYKGAGGGYELKTPPEQITLRQVIEVIEGPIVISRCQQSDYECDHPSDCACYFHHIFSEISTELAEKLEKVNFAPRINGKTKY